MNLNYSHAEVAADLASMVKKWRLKLKYKQKKCSRHCSWKSPAVRWR